MKTFTNFKIGDKLKCIETFVGQTQVVYYIKDNIYTISDIKNGTFKINTKYSLPLYFSENVLSYFDINKYFINIKTERKQKLLKINAAR
jgi:hypothetical protein